MKWSLKIRSHRTSKHCYYLVKGVWRQRQSETNILFNNIFKLNLLQLTTFWLVNITMTYYVLLWLECSHVRSSAPLVSGIVCNVPFHSSPHINQTQIIHIPHFCLVDLLWNYAPHFVVNWRIEVRAVWRSQIWKFIGVPMISLTVALLEWRQRFRHRMLRQTQLAEKIMTSRMTL